MDGKESVKLLAGKEQNQPFINPWDLQDMFKVNGGKLDPRNSLQEVLSKCLVTWELENLGL